MHEKYLQQSFEDVQHISYCVIPVSEISASNLKIKHSHDYKIG